MEKTFEPLQPCFVGNVHIKVLAADECGRGFSSPCPQLYLTIQDKKVAIIGYENIKKIRDMLDHALSNGSWGKPHSEMTEEEINKKLEIIHGKDYKKKKRRTI